MPELATSCQHYNITGVPEPTTSDCQECGVGFSTRLCLVCGHVGCCDSSSAHARSHWKDTGHPVMKAMPADRDTWFWCYDCNAYLR